MGGGGELISNNETCLRLHRCYFPRLPAIEKVAHLAHDTIAINVESEALWHP